MFYAVVCSKRTAAAQTLQSLPDILRLGVLHCCILGSIIFIMRTRFGRSLIVVQHVHTMCIGEPICSSNAVFTSVCMHALPCWKSVPKGIRIDLRASKIQKFPGGGMPPGPPSGCVLHTHRSGPLYWQQTRG